MFLIEIERRRNGTSFSIFIIDNYPLKGVHGIFKKTYGVKCSCNVTLSKVWGSNTEKYSVKIYKTEKYRVQILQVSLFIGQRSTGFKSCMLHYL